MTSLASRIATVVVAVVVGAVYGTAATIAHAYRFGILPVGLIVAVVGTTGLLIALRLLTGSRGFALAGGLGVIGAAFMFANIGPGGSVIMAAGTPDTEWIAVTWSFAVPLLVAVVVAWPDVSGLRPQRRLES